MVEARSPRSALTRGRGTGVSGCGEGAFMVLDQYGWPGDPSPDPLSRSCYRTQRAITHLAQVRHAHPRGRPQPDRLIRYRAGQHEELAGIDPAGIADLLDVSFVDHGVAQALAIDTL